MAQAAQHHRHRGEPQIRLGLPSAGREEQQVHRLTVAVLWIGEAGQVQQQERELERSPPRPVGSDLVAEPLAQGARHRPVRDPESVQQIGVLAQPDHAAGHAVGRHRRVVEQLLGRLPSRTRQGTARHLAPPRLDPAAVLLDEGTERPLRRGAAVQPPQDLHRQLDPGHVRRRRLLHLGRADPGGADGSAPAVLEVPFGRDPVPGRVLRRVGVVEVGDLVVPFRRVRPAQVRPRHEAPVRPYLDLGLEGISAVGLRLVGRTPVHQEARRRARAGRQLRAVRPHRADRPLDDVKLQPARAGDIPHQRPGVSAERDRQHCLVRSPPPDRSLAPARFLDIGRRVVAPAHRHRQLTASCAHEKAQPDRRRDHCPSVSSPRDAAVQHGAGDGGQRCVVAREPAIPAGGDGSGLRALGRRRQARRHRAPAYSTEGEGRVRRALRQAERDRRTPFRELGGATRPQTNT